MKIKEMDMEKKVTTNIRVLIGLLEKIEAEELTTTQLYELNNRVEVLKEWLYRDVLFPRRIFF
jgi:hypothetical protein